MDLRGRVRDTAPRGGEPFAASSVQPSWGHGKHRTVATGEPQPALVGAQGSTPSFNSTMGSVATKSPKGPPGAHTMSTRILRRSPVRSPGRPDRKQARRSNAPSWKKGCTIGCTIANKARDRDCGPLMDRPLDVCIALNDDTEAGTARTPRCDRRKTSDSFPYASLRRLRSSPSKASPASSSSPEPS